MLVDSTYLVYGAVFGMVLGSVAGRGPYSVAKALGRPGTGMLAVAICMTVGFLGGIFAFPAAWFLSSYIKSMGPADCRDASGADPAAGPFTTIGRVIVCNKCRHSCSRGRDGGPPSECPSCHYSFGPGAKRQPSRGSGRRDEDLVELQVVRPGRR